MMRRHTYLILTLLCLMLIGCGKTAPETTIPSEIPTTVATEPTTMPTTVPPTTEPEVILEAGKGVFADGDGLVSGSVISDGIPYMKLSEFLSALDRTEYEGSEEDGYRLKRLGRIYTFSGNMDTVLIDGTETELSAPVIRYQKAIWVPVQETCALLDISFLDDEAGGNYYCTSTGSGWDWERGVNIPILMYHGVADETWGVSELFVRPDDLEEQIQYLLDHGYDPITFEDWSHLEDFDKPVMLTFDDGYVDNYENLFPILQKYNIRVTIFVISASVDLHKTSMTYYQVRELAESGLVSIQSHTYTHPHLDECDRETLDYELWNSKLTLTRMSRYEPFVLCYPYGDRSELSLAVTEEYYRFGLIMNGGLCTTGDHVYEIPRYYVSRYTTLSEFAAKLTGSGREE